jgi:hypothetical protein
MLPVSQAKPMWMAFLFGGEAAMNTLSKGWGMTTGLCYNERWKLYFGTQKL